MTKKKLLLVDDDVLMQRLYTDVLSPLYHVETASDGKVAHDLILSNQYDLILMDMLLPQMNGIDVITTALSTLPKKRKINVVFLTNLEGAELKEVKKLGFPYIIKSQHTPDEFVVQIKKYIK